MNLLEKKQHNNELIFIISVPVLSLSLSLSSNLGALKVQAGFDTVNSKLKCGM